jgi:hypothetical protein
LWRLALVLFLTTLHHHGTSGSQLINQEEITVPDRGVQGQLVRATLTNEKAG